MAAESIVLLDDDAWKFIDASLANGTGLTLACEGMNISVKDMSEFLREKPNSMAKRQAQVTMGYKALVTIINNHAAEAKVSKWRDGHRGLQDFVKSLNLWEQHCKREDFTPQKVSEAFYIYRQQKEVATVLGMTQTDFYQTVLGDIDLKNYLIEAGFIQG
jgi:hypothetical protein